LEAAAAAIRSLIMIRRAFLRYASSAMLAMSAYSFLPAAQAEPADMDNAIGALQKEWAEIQYQMPEAKRETGFEALAQKAHAVTAKYNNRAEPHIWEGIILSSWAGAKGGLGALGIAKQAKAEYETAIQ